MITEYERKICDHPIIKEVLLWHDDAWLDGTQLEAILRINRHKLKRLLQQIDAQGEISFEHSEVFSVVRQRCKKDKQTKSDWIYQIRYYDTTILRLLAEYCETEPALNFLRWWREQSI